MIFLGPEDRDARLLGAAVGLFLAISYRVPATLAEADLGAR